MNLTLLALWLHVPFVTAWVGLVMFDVFAAAAPGLHAEQRGRLIAWSRPFVVVAIVVIVITGVRQTIDNPFLQVNSWSTLEQLRERTYGLALFWKHVFVLATFALTLIVRFVLAPRLMLQSVAAGDGATPAAASVLRSVLWLSVLNLAARLGALVLATRMVWELH